MKGKTENVLKARKQLIISEIRKTEKYIFARQNFSSAAAVLTQGQSAVRLLDCAFSGHSRHPKGSIVVGRINDLSARPGVH